MAVSLACGLQMLTEAKGLSMGSAVMVALEVATAVVELDVEAAGVD